MTILVAFAAENPVRLSMSWRTNVLTARDGTEHRRAMLTAPRQRLAQSYILRDDQLRALTSRLFRDPLEQYEVPLRHEGIPIQDELTANKIYVDPTYLDWAAAGQRVMVEGPDEGWQSALILSVAAISGTRRELTLTNQEGEATLPAGSVVFPLFNTFLEDRQDLARYAPSAGTWNLSALINAVTDTMGTGATVGTFDDLPLIDRRALASSPPSEHIIAGSEFLDQGAAVLQFDNWEEREILHAHSFFLGSSADRQWWKKFLYTVRGRQRPFLLPTWRDDLLVATQPPPGSGTLVIDSETNYVDDWFPSLAHRRIQLELSDGTVIQKKVNSCVDNLDGTQTLSLTTTLDGTPVDRVSFLELSRLAEDTVEFEFTDGHGVLNLPIQVVQQ